MAAAHRLVVRKRKKRELAVYAAREGLCGLSKMQWHELNYYVHFMLSGVSYP